MNSNREFISIPKFKKRLKPKDALMSKCFWNRRALREVLCSIENQERVLAQGDAAASVMYIQNGGIKDHRCSIKVGKRGCRGDAGTRGTSLVRGAGRPANSHGKRPRLIMPLPYLSLRKKRLTRVLHAEHELSDRFMAYVLSRNIRIERIYRSAF